MISEHSRSTTDTQAFVTSAYISARRPKRTITVLLSWASDWGDNVHCGQQAHAEADRLIASARPTCLTPQCQYRAIEYDVAESSPQEGEEPQIVLVLQHPGKRLDA